MTGCDDHEAVPVVTMRQRNSSRCGNCIDAADSRNDFEWNARCGEHESLFAASSKNKRVPALEAAHGVSGIGFGYQERVDPFLDLMRLPGLFPDVDDFGIEPRFFKQGRMDQPVVNDHVGLAQASQSLDRDQSRITRPGAGNVDEALSIH